MRRLDHPPRALLSGALYTGLLLMACSISILASSCAGGAEPTDALRSQILAEIHADVRIAPYEVQVAVESVDPGRVVLSGSVDRPQVKELAQQITAGVAGVDVVDNQIEVRGPRGAQGSPGDP